MVCGLWFVCIILLFGWKILFFIYYIIGFLVLGFLRLKGIFWLLYIDDWLNGEFLIFCGLWLVFLEKRFVNFLLDMVSSVLFVVLFVLVEFGYIIGIKKFVLFFFMFLEYLGFIVDFIK